MLGQTGVALALVAVGDAAISVHHAVKTQKIQKKLQKKATKQEIYVAYIKNMVSLLQSKGTRLAQTLKVVPGTKEFEVLLKDAVKNDIIYKGYCNADIYEPYGKEFKPNDLREVIGKFTRGGYVDSKVLPKTAGLIWAAGCKNAQDAFRIARIKRLKGEQKFQSVKIQKTDIGVLDLLLRYGTGVVVFMALLLILKVQSSIVAEQK